MSEINYTSVSTVDDEIFYTLLQLNDQRIAVVMGFLDVRTTQLNHNAINVYSVFITLGLHYALNTI